mgnify:CR=1 FL=1
MKSRKWLKKCPSIDSPRTGIIWQKPEKLYHGDDMLLAAFIILLIIALGLLPISFIAAAEFKENGFSLNLRVRLAYVITLYGWDSREEGLDFLLKKRAKKKKKKKRMQHIMRSIFKPDALLNIKGMTVVKFEVSGVIATHDAAATAILYGFVCAVISVLIPHLNRGKVLTDFYPDFQRKEPDFLISCIIRIRIIHIIYHIIYLIANLFIGKYLKGRWHNLWNRIQFRT